MLKGNMLIAHGGGPTPVINSSLLGAVREAKLHGEIVPSIRRRLTATKKASAWPFKKAAFPVKSFSSRPKSGFQTAAMKKRKLPLKNRFANCAQAIWT